MSFGLALLMWAKSDSKIQISGSHEDRNIHYSPLKELLIKPLPLSLNITDSRHEIKEATEMKVQLKRTILIWLKKKKRVWKWMRQKKRKIWVV